MEKKFKLKELIKFRIKLIFIINKNLKKIIYIKNLILFVF